MSLIYILLALAVVAAPTIIAPICVVLIDQFYCNKEKQKHKDSCCHCKDLHKIIEKQNKELKLLRPLGISFSE